MVVMSLASTLKSLVPHNTPFFKPYPVGKGEAQKCWPPNLKASKWPHPRLDQGRAGRPTADGGVAKLQQGNGFMKHAWSADGDKNHQKPTDFYPLGSFWVNFETDFRRDLSGPWLRMFACLLAWGWRLLWKILGSLDAHPTHRLWSAWIPLDDWLRYFGKSRDRESVTCSHSKKTAWPNDRMGPKHTETIPALLFQMLIPIPRKIQQINHTKPFNNYVFNSFIILFMCPWPLVTPWPLLGSRCGNDSLPPLEALRSLRPSGGAKFSGWVLKGRHGPRRRNLDINWWLNNVCVILIVMLLSFLVNAFCWLFSVVMFVVILAVVVCVFVISLVIFFAIYLSFKRAILVKNCRKLRNTYSKSWKIDAIIGETSARAASHWCQLLSSSGELLVATPCQMRRISVVGGPVLVVILYLVSMKWVWGYPNFE